MAKEFFKNLPDTSTPLIASRLNGLLDGDESMGNIIVESLKAKNMFDKNAIVSGDISDGNKTIRVSSRQILWLEAGYYTFSTNLSSTFEYDLLVQNVGIPPLSAQPTFIYNSGWISSTSQTFNLSEAGYFTVYIRKADNSSITLSEVKNFNYQLEKGDTATSHSDYQNLTGLETTTRIVNCDDATTAGVYQYVSTTTNIPPIFAYGNIIVTKSLRGGNNYISQLAIGNDGTMAIRGKVNENAWSTWKEITLKTTSTTSGTLKNYFSTVDANIVARTGNVVQVEIRALVSTTIPNNVEFFTTPFTPALSSSNEIFIGVGGQYNIDDGIKWGYIGRNGDFRCTGVSAGKWVHINVTYLTED